MKTCTALCILTALQIIAGSCWAYPSLLGPTGGANLPVADTAGLGRVEVGIDYIDNSGVTLVDDQGNPWNTGDSFSTRVLFGVSPDAEIGVTFNGQSVSNSSINNDFFDSGDDASFWGVNAKYVWPHKDTDASFGVGGVFQEYSSSESTNLTQFYAVASQIIARATTSTPGIRGSLGANWTMDNNGDSTVRPFAVLDMAFAGGLHLSGEYQVKNYNFGDNAPISSAVARFPLDRRHTLVADIGLTNAYQGIYGDQHHHFFIGANFIFRDYFKR